MSIRFKIIALIMLSAFMVVLVGIVLFRVLALPYLSELERDQLLKDSARFNLLLEQELVRFESIAIDWGYWDDTYQFVRSHDEAYLETNFLPVWLEKYQADLLSIKSYDGDWTETLNLAGSSVGEDVLEDLSIEFAQDSGSGVVIIDDKAFLVGYSKVKGSNGEREPQGIVILAKMLDQAWWKSLGESFGSRITMTLGAPISEPSVVFLGERLARVELSLSVLNEGGVRPLVSLEEPREWRTEFDRSLQMFGFSAVFLFGVFILCLYCGLRYFLVDPLRRVRDTIIEMVGAEPGSVVNMQGDWNTRDDLKTLQMLTCAAGEIIVAQRQGLLNERDLFREKSLVDELTGLYNRRGLHQLFERKYGACDTSICCAIVDLDHFKRINDTYGHDVGDRVLVSFSDILREVFDEQVLIARSGGEEFAIITSRPPGQDVVSPFCQLKEKTRAELSSRAGLDDSITASVGFVSSLPPSNWSLGDFMRLADSALYQAKQTRDSAIGYEQLAPAELSTDCSDIVSFLSSRSFFPQRC